MANKQALRDLQTRLAERMQQVRTEQPGVSWLAVDCAGQGLLIALHQAGEISRRVRCCRCRTPSRGWLVWSTCAAGFAR